MVILEDIRFKYPKRKQFSLTDISFSISPGEIFTLLGPNGAGKTTLIRILSGLILPHKGTVSICGHDVLLREYDARKAIGLVLGDERTFYFRLSGAQNLEFFGGLFGVRRSVLRKRVQEVLQLVGLEKEAGLQFMRYSTGMRKRLNMARALLHEPQVLLLDEPNSGVDPESARKIRGIILELKEKGRTILLTTHNMEEAERMSDRIGFLKEGRLVKIGTVEDYKRLVRKRTFVVKFAPTTGLSEAQAQSIIAEIRKVTSFDGISFEDNRLTINFNGSFDVNGVLAVIWRNGARIESTNTYDASLEDVFMTLAR